MEVIQAPPASALAPAPAVSSAAFDPLKTMNDLEFLGLKQSVRPYSQTFTANFLGGALLSYGSILMMYVAGGLTGVAPGAVSLVKGMVFPIGLSMIVCTKSELLTTLFLTQSLPLPTKPEHV